MTTYRIIFIGLNNETLILIGQSNLFKIVATNYFEYFDRGTINPIDFIFRLIYKLHLNKRNRKLIFFFLNIWNLLYVFSSELYKNNKQYLNLIINKNIEIINANNTEFLFNFIKSNNIDLLLINSWSIIPNKILFLPKFKTINIHPSALPQYRGALPTLWTLKNKDKESALTYLVLNEKIDDGLIIGQHNFQIDITDNWLTLENKISLILRNTLINDILDYLRGNNYNIPVTKEPSYTGLYNEYRKINLREENSFDIYNKVGLYPYIEPFFYCYIDILGRKIHIKKIFLYESKKHDTPSQIKLNFLCVLFYSKNGILRSRLFIDISIIDSIFIIFNKLTNKI